MVERDLPPVLALIAEAAGEEAAAAIVRKHGGTRVTIPVGPGNNWLTRLVGPEKTAAIVEALGGAQRIDLPVDPDRGYLAARRERARRYAQLIAESASVSATARALGISERAVRKANKKRRERAPDLFD